MNRFEDGISCGWSIPAEEKQRKMERERELEKGEGENGRVIRSVIIPRLFLSLSALVLHGYATNMLLEFNIMYATII